MARGTGGLDHQGTKAPRGAAEAAAGRMSFLVRKRTSATRAVFRRTEATADHQGTKGAGDGACTKKTRMDSRFRGNDGEGGKGGNAVGRRVGVLRRGMVLKAGAVRGKAMDDMDVMDDMDPDRLEG